MQALIREIQAPGDVSQFFIIGSLNKIFKPELSSGTTIPGQFIYPVAFELIHKITGFSALQPGWDGYNAESPSVKSIENAIYFIRQGIKHNLPFYFSAPGVNGDVMVELQKGDKAAEVYFNPDGTSELLLFQNENCIKEGSFETDFENLIYFFKN